MTRNLEKVLAKINRPPFAHNFVRLVGGDPITTARNIVTFASGIPPFNYSSAYAVIKDRIQLGISLENALSAVRMTGAMSGRIHNESLVRAFFAWDEERRYSAANIVEFERAWFRVSRNVLVPVAPLTVLREKGKFLPLFICGWGKLGFNSFQNRLYLTICNDAFLSLEDFRESAAEFLFFPQQACSSELLPVPNIPLRKPEVWRRDQFELLSSAELNDAIECFLEGMVIAKKRLFEVYSESDGGSGTPTSGGSTPEQPKLI